MFINKEIDRLYSEGIIKPSMSPWRAQIVVVKDASNNKRRMCVDYSQTVNLFTDRQTDKFISYNSVLIYNAHKTITVKIIIMKKMSAFN